MGGRVIASLIERRENHWKQGKGGYERILAGRTFGGELDIKQEREPGSGVGWPL